MANAQNVPSTPSTQATQNNNNTQNITINHNSPARFPDETGYTMPPDTWIYGNPNLTYGGQPASGGVSNYTIDGVTPPVSEDASSAPMPIPSQSGIPLPVSGPDGASVLAPGQGDPAAPVSGLNGERQTGSSVSRAMAQSERMKNPLSMSATHTPSNSEEAYQASLRSLLDRNVGYFLVASFLIGTQQTVTWQGILHTVGSDYIVLYQPDYERYISCDIYSLKFVQFHNVKGIPYCAASQNWQGHSSF